MESEAEAGSRLKDPVNLLSELSPRIVAIVSSRASPLRVRFPHFAWMASLRIDPAQNWSPLELPAEIIRRARSEDNRPHYQRLSDPRTRTEQFQLMAVRLEGRPIAIPHKCKTIGEWPASHRTLQSQSAKKLPGQKRLAYS